MRQQKDVSRVASIGIWGPRASGKTAYLAALGDWAMQQTPEWKVYPPSDYAKAFLEQVHNGVFIRGQFPPPTVSRTIQEGEYEYLVVRQQPRPLLGPTTNTFRLCFLDMPGENFERCTDEVKEWLLSCQGLICMLNTEAGAPFEIATEDEGHKETYYDWLLRLFNVLREQEGRHEGRVTRPIAFCFTKMDMARRYAALQRVHDAAEYASRCLSPAIKGLIDHTLVKDRFKYFLTSVLGTNRGRPLYSERESGWEIKDAAKIRPFGIYEPLKWLLERIRSEPWKQGPKLEQ